MISLFGHVAYPLSFRAERVVEKPHLAGGLSEDPLSSYLHRSAVLSIAAIATGALNDCEYTARVFRQAFLLFQEKKSSLFDAYPGPDAALPITRIAQNGNRLAGAGETFKKLFRTPA